MEQCIAIDGRRSAVVGWRTSGAVAKILESLMKPPTGVAASGFSSCYLVSDNSRR